MGSKKINDLSLVQQGDVLIFRTDGLPKGLKPRQTRGGQHILAEGEVTGHYHGIDCGDACLMEDESGNLWMEVKEKAVVTHQEHGHMSVEPGTYRIGQVVEYDPFEEAIRKVKD